MPINDVYNKLPLINYHVEHFDSFGFGIASEDGTIYAVQTFSGSGESGGAGNAFDAKEIPQTALKHIKDYRAKAGLKPLLQDSGLEKTAKRVLEQDAETLPDNIFDFLPWGSIGCTSFRVQSASLCGSGTNVTAENLSTVISDWKYSDGQGDAMGGATATHLGLAAKATGQGPTVDRRSVQQEIAAIQLHLPRNPSPVP
ncbi:hypothetical protein [Paracoccus sp. JM45]|uniref:hypothetical protein n=1 Tax=Paracoccus sp. JM45 TaxID=2283626 RepID=UPI000E6BAFC8|nr:hypothetical protein [Paracoccus sp. JM45]RJE79110.1 hypothetical protein DWB67_13660 [Paracoccus sp. JM45]